MKRSEFNDQPAAPQAATLSFSPKGEVYCAPIEGKDFPIIRGNHPFELFSEYPMFFFSDRFYLYGMSRDKNGGSYYTTSYTKVSDTITLYESKGGESRQIAKGEPEQLRKEYRLATGVIVTVGLEIEKESFLVDLKFQASSRSAWLDFMSECRRARKLPDFRVTKVENEDFGFVYSFNLHNLDMPPVIENLFDVS
jgi:hypothetical protein